ncbi:DUF547 domain-containing protein [Hahella aquimaris]|uniref:DUF547 domain-containing protein n=1 Tax=Hahella sp. HNIBRBA332 TaxID=3015983 RepID=UPI00273BB173|nr:DUF547 domain-containing protein [Hahella sp. HNIBRBA332]WLQ15303.1 DUF547 domain-containing protein [Hahella sp. HNIBRBA332]
MSVRLFLILIFMGWLSGEAIAAPKAEYWGLWDKANERNPALLDHSTWTRLLQTRLSDDGDGFARLSYGRFTTEEKRQLDDYIASLTAVDPREYSRDTQMAYWINLYNALTVQLVLQHYPVDSIKEIGGGWFHFGPWDDVITYVQGQALTLNDIEHRILRPIWKDKRIHYAVNCASLGCPNLLPEAFDPNRLEEQLNNAAQNFIRHPKGVAFVKDGLRLSTIYDWYQSDFGSRQELLDHLTKYSVEPEKSRLSNYRGGIEYAYDWKLNDAR